MKLRSLSLSLLVGAMCVGCQHPIDTNFYKLRNLSGTHIGHLQTTAKPSGSWAGNAEYWDFPGGVFPAATFEEYAVGPAGDFYAPSPPATAMKFENTTHSISITANTTLQAPIYEMKVGTKSIGFLKVNQDINGDGKPDVQSFVKAVNLQSGACGSSVPKTDLIRYTYRNTAVTLQSAGGYCLAKNKRL